MPQETTGHQALLAKSEFLKESQEHFIGCWGKGDPCYVEAKILATLWSVVTGKQ